MSVKSIFTLISGADDSEQKPNQLAVAVLLFHLVRCDGNAKMLELMHMSELLRKEFELTQQELELIFRLADEQESKGIDTNEFTRELCNKLSNHSRMKLLEYLWILAFSDDQIEEQEASLIKRVAQQLELSRHEQAIAQENAEAHLGLDLF